MIPTPRPGPRHGDCQDCGRQHQGECHLAEMERSRDVTGTPLPPIRWRNATAEELAIWHGMPSWVAERMVADQLAGSTEMQHRGPNGELYALPSPAWRRMEG